MYFAQFDLREIGQLRHFQAFETAGIDALIGLQVHVDIESQAMERAAFTHAQPERRDLHAVDIHAGGACHATGFDTVGREHADHGILDGGNQSTHAHADAAQVDQRIGDDLARAVIGHVPTPPHPEELDPFRRQGIR